MSWQYIEKTEYGGDQYTFIKYSTSIDNSSTDFFNALGCTSGTISFTSSGNTTIKLEHSINNEDFYTIKTKQFSQTNNFLSLKLPMGFIKITNYGNTINNIHMLLKS